MQWKAVHFLTAFYSFVIESKKSKSIKNCVYLWTLIFFSIKYYFFYFWY